MHAFLTTDTGHSAALDGKGLVIVGTEAGVQLPMRADLGIGPRHFELQPVGGTYQIRALFPEWPVTVNGQIIHVVSLRDGDVIRAGAISLIFRLPAHHPVAAPALPVPPPASASPGQAFLSSTTPLSQALPQIDWSQVPAQAPCARETSRPKPLSPSPDFPIEELKSVQDFNSAFFAALIAVVLGGVGYFFGSALPWPKFLALVAAIGLGIGMLVRAAGKGVEPRFGYLAGLAGVAAVLAASVVNSQMGVAEHHLVETNSATIESQSFATESAPSPFQERPALFDPTSLDQPDTGAKLRAPSETPPLPEAPRQPVTSAEALGHQMVSPRTLLASLLIGILAWLTAFRRLALSQSSGDFCPLALHDSDTSQRPLRDRVHLEFGKETKRA